MTIDQGLDEASLTSFACITAMANLQQQRHQLRILDAADHALITHAIAPQATR